MWKPHKTAGFLQGKIWETTWKPHVSDKFPQDRNLLHPNFQENLAWKLMLPTGQWKIKETLKFRKKIYFFQFGNLVSIYKSRSPLHGWNTADSVKTLSNQSINRSKNYDLPFLNLFLDWKHELECNHEFNYSCRCTFLKHKKIW